MVTAATTAAVASEVLRFECVECSAKFKKMDHLNRHLLSHGNSRTYECSFCSSSFHRRDALLRHWRTCAERLKSGLPPPSLPAGKRGRKQNACARCARLKKKCSGTQPCDICVKQGHDCTYARAPASVASSSSSSDSPGLTPPPGPGPELDGATIELPPRFFDDGSSPAIMIPHTPTQWLDVTGLDAAQQLHLSISPVEHAFDPALAFSNMPPSTFPPSPPTSVAATTAPPPYHAYAAVDMAWHYAQHPPVPALLTPRPQFLSARLRFVVQFTSTNCIAEAFGCLNSSLRKQIMAMTPPTLGMAPSTQGLGLNLGWEQPNLAVPLGPMDPLSQQQYLLADVNTIFGKSSLPMVDSQQAWHPLERKSREIVDGLRDTFRIKARRLGKWDEVKERQCADFFSPQNLDKFIAAFWLFWSPNWPVLHRPTFDATARCSRLVAALAIMGACLTSEKSDRQQALGWMPSIEDWIFSNPYLSDQPIPHTMDDLELALIQGRIEAIQAAYTLLLMLLWEGSSAAQATRARRVRFPHILAASRHLHDFARSSDPRNACFMPTTRFEAWKMFAMRQECVRAILYVFLIDCAFIIYNNTPPRMIIGELQYDTVCPDSCFNAPDPDSWYEAMRQWGETGPATFLSISDLIETSLKQDLTPREWDSLEQTSLLNLFAIASAFHNLIFHHHHGPESHIRSDRVAHGLRNWVKVWGDRDPVPTEIDNAHPDLTGQPGFIRYVREYWSLAVIFNNQYEYRKALHPKLFEGSHGSAQRREDVRLMPETDSSNMSPIHELVVRFRDVDLSSSLC